jgi:hypothetical protein
LETTGEELETGGLVLEAGGDDDDGSVAGFGVGSATGFGGGGDDSLALGDDSLALAAGLFPLAIGSSGIAAARTGAPVSCSSFVSEGPTRLARAGGALPDKVVFCTALLEAIAGRLSDLERSV